MCMCVCLHLDMCTRVQVLNEARDWYYWQVVVNCSM